MEIARTLQVRFVSAKPIGYLGPGVSIFLGTYVERMVPGNDKMTCYEEKVAKDRGFEIRYLRVIPYDGKTGAENGSTVEIVYEKVILQAVVRGNTC